MAKVAGGGQPFTIAQGAQVPGDLTIGKIIHIASASGDTFLLQDGKGKLVCQGKASAAAAQSYDFPIPVGVNTLGCAQLSAGGTLLVFSV
jgi:hypothetical protein